MVGVRCLGDGVGVTRIGVVGGVCGYKGEVVVMSVHVCL